MTGQCHSHSGSSWSFRSCLRWLWTKHGIPREGSRKLGGQKAQGVHMLCYGLATSWKPTWGMHAQSSQVCLTLCDPLNGAHQAPLSMGFSSQQSWNGLPCPSPGDLPDTEIEPTSPVSPALQMDSSPLSHWGNQWETENI